MRKRISGMFWVLFVLLALTAIVCFVITDYLRPTQTKIPHAESKIMITFARDAVEKQTMEVDGPEDAAFLFALFGKQYTAEYDSPSCPFDWCWISFVHKLGSIVFYPAMDDCGFVCYQGKFFDITPEERVKLKEICQKYYGKRRQ